ncbi:hypothetical protein IAU59_004205 [Kwoniella sp. CBS 9459]
MGALQTSLKAAESISVYPPWDFHHWRAVDDRVRGGSSISHLDEIALPGGVSGVDGLLQGQNDVEKGKKAVGARFWGTLDTKTLGGAGFASQSYRYGPAPLQLPLLNYSGLTVSYLPDSHVNAGPQSSGSSSGAEAEAASKQPRKFTLVLKTTPTAHIPKEPKVPPQPRESQLTYEASFSLPSSLAPARAEDRKKVHHASFDWSEFQATYRGRPVHEGDERWVPLDPGVIYELSFMCRSDFGKQEGHFGVIITGLNANLKEGPHSRGESGWLSGVWRWFGGVKDWFRGLMGWQRIKLDDGGQQYDDEKRALIA